jgi:hypothetical protein
MRYEGTTAQQYKCRRADVCCCHRDSRAIAMLKAKVTIGCEKYLLPELALLPVVLLCNKSDRNWGYSGRRFVILAAPSRSVGPRPIARQSWPRDGAAQAASPPIRVTV